MALVWKHTQFVKFLKKNPRQAFEYRRDCFPWVAGYEIPEEYLTEEEKSHKPVETPETAPTIIETPKEDVTQAEVVEEASEKTYSRAELEDMLKNAGIKFSHLSKDETLIQKCIENKLL